MQETHKKIQKIYGICTAVLLVISAICLICTCISIYFANPEDPFSAEIVGTYFGYIAVPILLTLLCVVFGALVHFAFPVRSEKVKSTKNQRLILNRMSARVGIDTLNAADRSSVLKERKVRNILFNINILIYIVAICLALGFVLTVLCTELFSGKSGLEIEEAMTATVGACVLIMLALFAIPVGIHIFRIFYESRSIDREISILKCGMPAKSVSEEKNGAKDKKIVNKLNEKSVRYIVIGMLAGIAICFLIAGSGGDGMVEIWRNAKVICSSCIGLG